MKEKHGVLTLTFLTVTVAVYLILWQILICFFSFPVYYYGRLIELLALGLFTALAVFTPMRFEEMGILVPRRVLFRSIALGGGVGLVFVAILAAISWLAGGNIPFSWHVTGDISRMTYFVVAPFQEILAKSVMFYSFEAVFDQKHPHVANFLCALTFGTFHVVYGIEMMLAAMALSLVTGWIFMRERAVWGCAVTHFCCGFFPLCFGIG
ncbi:MAG: CPBP family intramembrane metalloprotease [Clostridia bacterium]|nr:CPBP family intramembrane metalloprotease [Clostridia bacterium]